MPCFDSRTDNCGVGAWRDEAELHRLQRRNDKLARMLCFVCGLMEERDMLVDDRTKSIRRAKMMELIEWWADHREFDKKRKKKSKV